MAVTRFGSQVVPLDSTEKVGYKWFPVTQVPTAGLVANATYAVIASGMPTGIKCNSTNAAIIITDADFVPNDLDTSATCYVSVGYASITTATDATATMAVVYQNIAAGDTVTTPAVTCGAISSITAAATVGYFTYSSSAAMSTKPTPGTLLAFKTTLDPLTADTVSVLGIKMQYTKRFL